MSLAATQHRRLRTALLLRLWAPLLLIVAVSAGVGGYAAHRLSDTVLDRSLMKTAAALADHVQWAEGGALLALDPPTLALLLQEPGERSWYSLREAGVPRAGEAGLPAEGDDIAVHERGLAFDAVYRGEELRIASVAVDRAGRRATVLVGQTMNARRAVEQQLRLMLLPTGLLLVAAAVAIYLAVRRTLRPLEAIAVCWEAHSHASLEPIDVKGVPRELLPFAAALNALLARTRALLQRERQFCENAAHQLRTPLAALELGLTRAAQAPDLPGTRNVLGELRRTVRRTSRMIQQLLVLARLDAQSLVPLRREPVDLCRLAAEIGEEHADQAAAKGLSLHMQAPDHPVLALADEVSVGEALGNLLDNALRYTPQGHVTLEVLADPPALRVSDSGPGIPEGEREAVFQRFVRGQAAGGEGSGLGLAIVRDIARLNGGEIDLAPGAQGGAVATLRLSPAAATAAPCR